MAEGRRASSQQPDIKGRPLWATVIGMGYILDSTLPPPLPAERGNNMPLSVDAPRSLIDRTLTTC